MFLWSPLGARIGPVWWSPVCEKNADYSVHQNTSYYIVRIGVVTLNPEIPWHIRRVSSWLLSNALPLLSPITDSIFMSGHPI
jgi:hypothetical protein